MAKNNNLSDFLTDIANSIRTKKGTTGTINAQNFSSEIASIETGITPTGSIDITSNGTVDVTNYASANVNVANQNPYTATNATEMAQYLASKYYGAVVKYTGTTGTYTQNRLYKVIQVTSNEYTFEELITPVGSTTKTENGTYDVKEYAEVVVNVPIGITPTGKKEITNTSEVDVTNYATAQVVDSNLVASNIKKDINILGVTGTLESGGGNTLKNVLDTTKSAKYLFNGCRETSVDSLIQSSDTENVKNMNNMFSYSLIDHVPQISTITVEDMSYMFNNCSNLITIPQLNTSSVTNMYNMFGYCSKLKSILMTNIGANLDISSSTQFERSDLVIILNNLKTVTSTKTLTMGATNLAKLTDEDKLIATNKG